MERAAELLDYQLDEFELRLEEEVLLCRFSIEHAQASGCSPVQIQTQRSTKSKVSARPPAIRSVQQPPFSNPCESAGPSYSPVIAASRERCKLGPAAREWLLRAPRPP